MSCEAVSISHSASICCPVSSFDIIIGLPRIRVVARCNRLADFPDVPDPNKESRGRKREAERLFVGSKEELVLETVSGRDTKSFDLIATSSCFIITSWCAGSQSAECPYPSPHKRQAMNDKPQIAPMKPPPPFCFPCTPYFWQTQCGLTAGSRCYPSLQRRPIVASC
jgi:hypothetical protein